MARLRTRLVGLAAIASLGCSIALDFSRVNLPTTRDAGATMDASPFTDLAPDAADAPDVVDASDAADAPDVVDAPDASDAPDVFDAPDAADAADAPDAPDVFDAPDVSDAPDAFDVFDAPDPFDAPDVRDVPVDVRVDRPDVGPPCDADLTRDPQNCGACGRRCTVTPCMGGVCSWCRPTLSLCGLSCYDLSTTNQHCGSCSTRCGGSTPNCCLGVCRARCN